MSDKKLPQLSKSRFMAGLQCHKRLFLECFNYEERDEVSSAQQAIFDSGTKVGELAQTRFPGGTLIAEEHNEQEQAIKSTLEAMANPKCPAIYEAAFTHDDVKIRIDILVRNGDCFDIVEVKSSTRPKDEHYFDLAIQTYVLRGAGIKVGKAILMTINNEYVYDGGEYEIDKLFSLHDLSEEVEEKIALVQPKLEQMRAPLSAESAPCVEVGGHCKKPYQCSFFSYCHKDIPDNHISRLPRISQKTLQLLKKNNVELIEDIPEDFDKLTVTQERARQSLVNNQVYYNQDMYDELNNLSFPLHFIDFETFNPALPLFKGTRPYQQTPFQWSAHTLLESGDLTHGEFLSDGKSDPRRRFAESLIKTVGEEGDILVYSSFEKSRLNEVARDFPDLKDNIDSMVDRFVDLLALIRAHFYHPMFKGSFSIKTVLPTLVPSLSYENLGIKEGATAANSFGLVAAGQVDEEEAKRIHEDLLEYCKLDTLAMVEIYKSLIDISRFELTG